MKRPRSIAVGVLASATLFACDDGPADIPPDPSHSVDERGEGHASATGEDPRILIRDTDLRVTPSAVLRVSELLGQLQRLQEAPAYFDEPTSFYVRVERAVSSISGPSLAALMNEYVFGYQDAPLSGISIEIRDGRLHQKATLEALVSIPISMTAHIEVTGEGSLLVVPEKMTAAGVPVTSLMGLFGIELEDVLDPDGSRGVTVMEDYMVLDPSKLIPTPALRARAESVSLEGDLLHLTLVRSEGPPISAHGLHPPEPEAPHFIFFEGGEVRFGKLTMWDTDLQITDDDPGDPFDFHPEQLHRQLVAGVSFTMPDNGLLVRVPDYEEIAR